MREVEQKINLENAQYEELMLELQLNKTKHGQSNGTGNGYPPGMDGHGHGGLGQVLHGREVHAAGSRARTRFRTSANGQSESARQGKIGQE